MAHLADVQTSDGPRTAPLDVHLAGGGSVAAPQLPTSGGPAPQLPASGGAAPQPPASGGAALQHLEGGGTASPLPGSGKAAPQLPAASSGGDESVTYRIEVTAAPGEELDSITEADATLNRTGEDVGGGGNQLQLPTPLISKELSMVTRELSMIVRQGTTVSRHDKERSATASPSLRSRAGLVSRISILPAAFTGPRPELDIDAVSGASVLHTSFLFRHAPCVRFLTQDLAVDQQQDGDDPIHGQIDDAVRQHHYLFPKSCFADALVDSPTTPVLGDRPDDEPVQGVMVQLRPYRHTTIVAANGTIKSNPTSPSEGNLPPSRSRSLRISVENKSTKSGVSDESLPLVTPRAILLTPEPSRAKHAENQSDSSHKCTSPLPPRKPQIMVCVKPVKATTKTSSKKRAKNKTSPHCQLADVVDVFREVLDQRGFDFFTPEMHGGCNDDGEGIVVPFQAEEDIVVVMESTKWPLVARRWFQRERTHWPPGNVIDELKTVPCHVTPFPAKDSGKLQFVKRSTYTYPLVDSVLFRSLTEKQLNVFAVLSILYQKHLCEPALLQLAHVKAVFFWACEQTPPHFWAESALSTCVFYVLNQLVETLNRFVVQHYVTEENLVAHAEPALIKELADMVRLVRRTPVESLINSDHFSPYDELLCEPVLNYMMAEQQPTWDAVSSIVLSAIKIGQSYVPQPGKQHAVQVLDDACQVVFRFRHFDEASIALVQVTADLYTDLVHLDKMLEYGENLAYVAYEYDDDNLDLSLCLSRLATLYHYKARNVDHQEADTWLQRAAEYFELALLEDYSLVSALRYAIFLLRQHRAMQALEQLTNSVALTDETDEVELLQDVTTFTQLDTATLDDDLAHEVRVMGVVSAPTVVMAYYYLCQALLDTGINKGLEEYTLILEILADSEVNSHRATTWALLGYVLQRRGERTEARRAFKIAMEQRKDYAPVLRPRLGRSQLNSVCATSACCVLS